LDELRSWVTAEAPQLNTPSDLTGQAEVAEKGSIYPIPQTAGLDKNTPGLRA